MHFANIEDTTNHAYADYQLQNFSRLIKKLEALKIKPTIRHTASSAALILFDKTRFEMVRPGISVYGHWPSKETYLSHQQMGGNNNLFQPVLTWKTRITQLKNIKADEFIGYGCTYRTTKPTRLAILPVGYYDGYSRALSNTAYVLIRGRRASVRGRICMNLMMVDVTDIKGAKLGDEVTLIGHSQNDAVTAEQLGAWSGTINYEILARISPKIPRLII
jgi:alanine racemase